MVWVILTSLWLTMGLCLMALWRIYRDILSVQEALASVDQISSRIEALRSQIALLRAEVAAQTAVLNLLASPAPPPPEPEYPAGTAFLPDDLSEAQMEQMIARSEDRSLGGPVRFSSRLSGTSGSPSRRVPSTQRVPRSGSA